MTSERWQKIKPLLESALEREPSEREEFLDGVCGGDQSLRQELESFIISHEQARSFMEEPAVEVMAESITNNETGSIVGQALAHYKILAQIGSGGMGEVYLAEDTRLGRKVALKLLPAYFTGDDERLRRFQQEARAASALNHPNILTIYEIGQLDSRHFIATEFVEGQTLRQQIKDGPMKIGEALDIAIQVASALRAAHQTGIVHRDIKPENIMLRHDALVKLLDFGLAKLTEPLNKSEAATLLNTRQGVVMGTARYMSPEQARGLDVDARTDIFSLGIVVYEMLTGQVPFEGETPADIVVSVLTQEPRPIDQSVPQVPFQLQQIVKKALSKDKEERYQTIENFVTELKDLNRRLESKSGPGRSVSPEFKAASRLVRTMDQEIHFCKTTDGVRIAYATVGEGPPILKAANWLNHLEFDWRSPIWRHVFEAFAQDHLLVRYDERGNGLSDWNIEDFSLEAMVRDMEAVVEAVGLERFPILGISQGGPVGITYAIRHPEKVSHLILYGSYARGWAKRGAPPEEIERREAYLTLARLGWGQDNPAFRQLWTTLFLPDATQEQWHWFNDLQRITTSPENAFRILTEFGNLDVTELLPKVKVPTLVLHCRNEAVAPFEEGRLIAALIPGARFVPLEGRNHLLLENESAWSTFLAEVRRFLRT